MFLMKVPNCGRQVTFSRFNASSSFGSYDLLANRFYNSILDVRQGESYKTNIDKGVCMRIHSKNSLLISAHGWFISAKKKKADSQGLGLPQLIFDIIQANKLLSYAQFQGLLLWQVFQGKSNASSLFHLSGQHRKVGIALTSLASAKCQSKFCENKGEKHNATT